MGAQRAEPRRSGRRNLHRILRRIRGCLARLAALSAAIFLAACQPSMTPQAHATPRILTVAVTPALQPLKTVFSGCAAALGDAGLVVLDTPAQAIDLSQTPLALRWGEPAAGQPYAAVVGQEDLVVVVNPKNSVQQIDLDALKRIYTGALREWPGVSPAVSPAAEIAAWAYPEGDDAEAVFETTVLGAPLARRLVSTAPDPSAMRESIARDTAAVGFLPRRWLDSSVKALTLSGLDSARLRQPILALSPSEPTGLEKSWLLCIQARLKE